MQIAQLKKIAYDNAKLKGFHEEPREFGTSIMLIVTELAEAVEAHRMGNWGAVKEEIADTFIRLGDLCGEYEIDIEHEIIRKMAFNADRPAKHGKRY